jgi:hypothetical protein
VFPDLSEAVTAPYTPGVESVPGSVEIGQT